MRVRSLIRLIVALGFSFGVTAVCSTEASADSESQDQQAREQKVREAEFAVKRAELKMQKAVQQKALSEAGTDAARAAIELEIRRLEEQEAKLDLQAALPPVKADKSGGCRTVPESVRKAKAQGRAKANSVAVRACIDQLDATLGYLSEQITAQS